MDISREQICEVRTLKRILHELVFAIAIRDAIHTHFVTLIVKWTIVGGWVKHRADKRGKVTKLKYKSFVTSPERADKKTGWVGKKLIVHLPIGVTMWVWMASLKGAGIVFIYICFFNVFQ